MNENEHPASDNEIVTRFEKNRNLIKNKHLKYASFMDARYPQELSVFSIANLIFSKKEDEIWAIANNYAFKKTQSKVKGRADLNVGEIKSLKIAQKSSLNVFIDDIPCKGHGNIRFVANERMTEIATAQALANIATHHIK